jgi:hypothetical protein
MKLTLILFASLLHADTFTGVITDTMCGKGHKAMNIAPDEKCVHDCVKLHQSVKYALYDGKNVYKLSDQKLPMPFAAKRVTITGKLFEKTGIIQVEKIEPAR